MNDYFEKKGLRYRECLLYETLPAQLDKLPDLNKVDEIHFTSPSTVRAFLKLYGCFPKNKSLTAIGPVTQEYLQTELEKKDMNASDMNGLRKSSFFG